MRGNQPAEIPSDYRTSRRLFQGMLLALVALIALNGCKSADEVTNCVYYLNQKDFQRVADDESCSTYERASAELGLAGFLFANFLSSDATDNFRSALGIPSSAQYWNTWDGKTHYSNARRLSGDSTGDTYHGQSRLNEDIEIHYFATLGGLLAQTYIELDKDANGDISEAEIQAFTAIRPSTDASYGENQIVTADWMQFVKDKGQSGEKVYLLNLKAASNGCLPKTSLPKFDGIWGSATGYDISDVTNCGLIQTPTNAELLAWAAAGEGRISITGECTLVTKIEQIQNLFLSSSSSSEAMSVTELSESYVGYINSIGSDLEDLGIPEDSDLRKSLREFSAKLDNGGSCSNTTLAEVNQIFDIIAVAVREATSDYRETNIMDINSITSASDTKVEVPTSFVTNTEISNIPIRITFSCSNASNLSARLIYKSNSGYVAYYQGASSAIANTFDSLKNLNFDAQGIQKADRAGDEVISFKELLCMQ